MNAALFPALSPADIAAKCDAQADAEVERNITARQLGDHVAADRHLARGQMWLRVAEILRDAS